MSIQFKRSSAINLPPEPAHLVPGELAINLADKKLYTKNDKNEVINIGFNSEYAEDTFLKRSGGNLTGPVVLFEGTLPTKLDEIVSKRYVDSKFGSGNDQVLTNSQLGSTYIKKAGDTMTGKLRLNYQIVPADDQYHAVNKQFTEASYLKLSGGSMTGLITIRDGVPSNAPGNALITKDFANSAYINSAGDTMQGALELATAPTAPNHAAPKSYVDSVRNDAFMKTGGDINGSVAASGSFLSWYPDGFRIAYGGYGAFWRNDGANMYLLFTNNGNPQGQWNGLRPFRAELANGRVTMENGLTVSTDVYVGGTTNTGEMYARGNANVNDVYIRSDKTLKEGFEPIENALDKLCTLTVSTYIKEGKATREAGLIAQEVREILPEAVAVFDKDKLSISPMGVIALLVKSVQELKAEIDELKKNQK